LESCQIKARENYPLIIQYGLIETAKDFRIENANKNFLPQLTISAKATYQSEVTEIPISMPGLTPLSKDQYGAVAQIEQSIWDGGVTGSIKRGILAQREFEKKKLEVDLYALRDRINQLFFGIILQNEQLVQIEILKNELVRSLNKVISYKENGLANQSDIDAIRIEQINADQKEVEVLAAREAFISMLSAMIGEDIKQDAIFERPLDLSYSIENRRPELFLFDSQKAIYEAQKEMVASKNRMKMGAFIQAGYGKPGLNMLKNEFSPYYIAGVKVSWSLGGYYTKNKELKLLNINNSVVESQKNVFLFNSGLRTTQQIVQVNKIKSLMERDNELIMLRENIKNAAESKLENGTISISDFLREINMLDLARNNKAKHEVELLMAIYDVKNNTNN
jgi:outer membrane protein TolC